MPFGDYKDFKDCVEKNSDKENPEAFCAYLHHKITGNWPGEKDMEAAKDVITTKTLYDVEVFAAGTWTDSGGNTEDFPISKLDGMVRNFREGVAALKTGHSPDEFNAQVAQALDVPVEVVTGSDTGQGAVGLGRMVHLKRAGNRLLAVFKGVPVKIVELIKGGLYNSVSAELTKKEDGSYEIRGVALLGAQHPAVDVLEGRLSAAKVYSFTMSEPTIADVTPVPQGNTKKKNQEADKNMDTPQTNQQGVPVVNPNPTQNNSGGEALKAIAQELGLDPEKATVQEIVDAVKALKGGNAAQAATGPLMARLEETKVMFAASEAKAQAEAAKVKNLETEVSTLKRDKKVLTFTERAKNWATFVSDVNAEVQALVDMPENQAKVIADGYDRMYEAMKKSQFFDRVGPVVTGKDAPIHEFDAKVRKYATDNKVAYWDAMLKCQAGDPKGYQAFMEFVRKDQFQTFQATQTK